ncbi:hypothetical protein D3C79_865620 [compost metagenome]
MSGGPAWAAGATLQVEAPVNGATCNITLPGGGGADGGQFSLGRYIQAEFEANGGTAATLPVQVTITGCDGDAGTTQPALKVSGTTLADNVRVFNNAADSAAGFMLRAEKYTGSLTDFYSTTDPQVVKSGDNTYDGSAGLKAGGTVDYTVGFVVPPGKTAASGDVNASVTFDFLYH